MAGAAAVTDNGWEESAAAWIANVNDDTDFGRRHVLDAPMIELVSAGVHRQALDVGCGEGRFSRMLRSLGIDTIGVDPTASLLKEARRRDPDGDYRAGSAESLEFSDETFDLVVSYMTLLDMPDVRRAITEMCRVLAPGGRLLIANMNSFSTSTLEGWKRLPSGELYFPVDQYLEERAAWVEWNNIRVQNWHRPLSIYMQILLQAGLSLLHFDEPAPRGGRPEEVSLFRRVPEFVIMEWEKPAKPIAATITIGPSSIESERN